MKTCFALYAVSFHLFIFRTFRQFYFRFLSESPRSKVNVIKGGKSDEETPMEIDIKEELKIEATGVLLKQEIEVVEDEPSTSTRDGNCNLALLTAF